MIYTTDDENANLIPANFVSGWSLEIVTQQADQDEAEMREMWASQRATYQNFCQVQDDLIWDLA